MKMSAFSKRAVVVDGIRVEVLEAGSGEPLVYFHGAGTTSGFQDLLPLSRSRRLIVPIHPGFGASDNDAGINSVLDYVVHYNALFDQLDLMSPFDLIGHSLGGWMASLFTVLNGRRVRRLALACPAGLRVAEHPTADMFTIRAEQVPAYIVSSPEALARIPSTDLTVDVRVGRYRELTSLARIIWDKNYDPKLIRWLKRIGVPTLILWGTKDRIIPIEQAKVWASLVANSEIETFEGAGHLLFFEAPEAVARLESFLADDAPTRKAAS
jgi:pimeloyl-ACP methyl ester carboxylesterase